MFHVVFMRGKNSKPAPSVVNVLKWHYGPVVITVITMQVR